MISWEIYGPGEQNPDLATEEFFTVAASHLGVVPWERCDLGRRGTEFDEGSWQSELLPTMLKIDVIRAFRVVYHEEGEQRFTRSHSMVPGTQSSIQDAIDTYSGLVTSKYYLDAVVELILIGCGDMKTHRFNLAIYPTGD